MKTIADKIIKFRWLIIVVFVVITAIFALQIPKAEISPNVKSMLPHDIESRINTEKIDELFGGTEMVMVLIKTEDVLDSRTLKRVENISKQMSRTKGIDKVLSLFDLKNIKGEAGAMVIDPAVESIPKTDAQREKLRKEIGDNDLVYGTVISKDFTLTAVIALIEIDVADRNIVEKIKKVVKDNPGEEEVVIGGLPYMRVQVGKNIQSDITHFLPLGLLIMLVFLYICLKQLRGVVLPFSVVVMSILVSMGMIPVLGWKIQVITVILPVFLIAVANDYGIHIIARYQEDNVEGNTYSKKELAKRVFQSLSKPVLLTGLTSIAGILCLLGHIIIPARQLSILASVGIVFALSASLFFIPAILSFLPKSKPVPGANNSLDKKPLLERMLSFFGNFVSEKPKAIIAGALVFTAIVSVGIFFVTVDSDPNNYFPKDSPIVHAQILINENLGGAQNISIVFEGDIKTPRIMKKIDRLERKIAEIPEVGDTTSIARVIRQMSRALNDKGEEWYDKIPDTRNAIAQYLALYSMSGDPEDLEKMVDFPYEHAMITARINTTSTPKLDKVIKKINEIVKDDKDVKLIGGFGLILSELSRLIINGQLISLGVAIVVIGIMLMILFRSIAAGFISALPLALSIMILFGLMGFFNIELNIATALLSSIMIGVGVDYTIHFLWRYKEERQKGLMPQKAVKKTLTTTGRGIVFNAFSVIVGFIVLLSSSFMPVRFFGFLVMVSILACLFGALILIPALCLIFRPKFLEPS